MWSRGPQSFFVMKINSTHKFDGPLLFIDSTYIRYVGIYITKFSVCEISRLVIALGGTNYLHNPFSSEVTQCSGLSLLSGWAPGPPIYETMCPCHTIEAFQPFWYLTLLHYEYSSGSDCSDCARKPFPFFFFC